MTDNDKFARGGLLPPGMTTVQNTLHDEYVISPASFNALDDDMRLRLGLEPTGPLDAVVRKIKAQMDGMICGRCHKATGNNTQGHYWAFCKVTRTTREHHFCCPDDCALEATDGLQ